MSGRVYQYGDLAEPRTVKADVCVIGSGCGGATMAHLLSREGAKVVVLERGGYYPSGTFDQNELNMNAKLQADRGFKASADGGVNLLSGNNVGGASVHYWADSYRTPVDRLTLWAERYGITGHGATELAPAWDEIERVLNVHVAGEAYHNRMNQLVRDGASRLGWRGHAVPQARRFCQKSGHCMQGCLYEAKQSQLVTHLRSALEHGTDVYADVSAQQFRWDGARVRGLTASVNHRPSNRPSGVMMEVQAGAYVVAAGGYNSAALLMRNGLSERLPMLGKGFAFNPSPMVHALYPEDIVLWRNIPAAWGIDEFRLARRRADGGYLEGGYLLMPNQVHPATLAATLPLMGDEHGHWMAALKRIGSTIGWIDDDPDELGELRLDRHGGATVHYPFGPTTTAMLRDLVAKQLRLHRAAGAQKMVVAGSQALVFRPGDPLDALEQLHVDAGGLHMGAPHPSGGCRMGRTPKDSVVDSSHRVHGIPNLFVADSSVFPTSASVDPSLTIMGFSYVAARHVLAQVHGRASL